MFNILKKEKKNINTDEIKDFNNILKVIEDFIYFEDFKKSTKAINEIIEKENESFNIYINSIEEKKKKEEINKFKKKLNKIYKLREKNEIEKKNFNLKLHSKKKKEEINFTRTKLNELIGKSEFVKGISLLSTLIDNYNDDTEIINFVTKQKKILNKNIELEKKKKENIIKNDAYLQAQDLIGEIKNNNIIDEKKENITIFQKLKNTFFFYGKIKKKLRDKKLLDEVNLLLQIESEENNLIVKTKLAQIHSGISKEISGEKINGYELYGKILGADKISGDSLGFDNSTNKYTFFIGDATGHGIRAGFIISQLTKKFQELASKVNLDKLVIEINNSLKQDLKSCNFITSIFFSINKADPNKLFYVGMGHEPMFLYKKSTQTIEKIIPGGLAAGIRIIKDIVGIKTKELILDDGDILICYTDGIAEARNENGEMYGINRIGEKLGEFAINEKISINDIYKNIINDLKNFTGGKNNYLDDVSIVLLKRDKNKDIIEKDEIIEEIIKKEGLDRKYKKNIKGKDLNEIRDEILKLQNENALKNIIKHLDTLYKTGELPKLKQDCIRYIKEGYIHKKINKYLRYTLHNENLFKIKQKEQKVGDKFNILKELYKKGDYETVITECSGIISRDGNI